VHQLAADRRIRQFLDIVTGLPTADNTHEVAQRPAADSRIVYVDYDLVVLAHARALLDSHEAGPPNLSTRTSATPTRSLPRQAACSTSADRWRSR
jgi:hypothetical protein